MKKKDYLMKQLEERIVEIEHYSKADHFSKKDYIMVILVAFVCVVVIIMGAYL